MQKIGQNKKVLAHLQYKMENNELKKLVLKIARVINSMTQLKLQILILVKFYWSKNHMKILSFVTFHIKLWLTY